MTGAALVIALAMSARAQTAWSPAWTMPEDLRFKKAGMPKPAPFDPDAPPEPDPPPTGDDDARGQPRQFATAPLSYSGVRRLSADEYPSFADDLDPASLAAAAGQSDLYWSRLGDLTRVTIDGRRYTVGQLRASARELVRLARGGSAALQAQIPARFDVFASARPEVVFTAYYAPEIEATATRDAAHPMPLYARPAELVDEMCRFHGRVKACWTRGQIDRGALAGRGLELAWASPADVFDLQLEGSGTIVMGGQRRRLEYDGSNGRPFRSAERALRNAGGLPEGVDFFDFVRSVSVPRQLDILEENPRYTFFHDAPPGRVEPVGALGTMLTAQRSLAVSRQMPRGLPAFIDVNGIRRFAFAQDAGQAISDPGRADIYWGGGPRAGADARRFKYGGRLYFLVLKNAPSN